MPKEFSLSVVAPDKAVVDETVTSVILPGSEGYLGVMADHLPVIASLKPGLLEYVDPSGLRHYVYVGGGFAEVNANKMTVLADEAQRAKEIDLSRAESELESARKALRGETSALTTDEAVQEVEKAMHRLKAARISR